MDNYLSYFIYGQPVALKHEGNTRPCFMVMCESNLSFMEFIDISSFKIVNYLYL